MRLINLKDIPRRSKTEEYLRETATDLIERYYEMLVTKENCNRLIISPNNLPHTRSPEVFVRCVSRAIEKMQCIRPELCYEVDRNVIYLYLDRLGGRD